MELAVADVERDHPGGARLQQAVGEAAGRGADVEAVLAGDVDAEGLERRASFSPPRETKRGPRSTSSSALSSTCSPALECPFTRPARTSACACERLSASPRSTSSTSRRFLAAHGESVPRHPPRANCHDLRRRATTDLAGGRPRRGDRQSHPA